MISSGQTQLAQIDIVVLDEALRLGIYGPMIVEAEQRRVDAQLVILIIIFIEDIPSDTSTESPTWRSHDA